MTDDLFPIIVLIILVVVLVVVVIQFNDEKTVIDLFEQPIEPVDEFKRLVSLINQNTETCSLSSVIPYTIYYINLEKDVEKRKNMENKLLKYNLNGVRINAIDGKTFDNFKTDYDYADDKMYKKHQIGCISSHIYAIQYFYNTSMDDICLIVEDDVEFSSLCKSPTVKLSDICQAANPDWDIISINTIRCDDDDNTDIKLLKRVSENEVCWSTGAYIINKKGAKKIIDQCIDRTDNSIRVFHTRENYPRNGVADEYLYAIVNTYYTKPSLVSTDCHSYMKTDDDVKNNIVYKYINNGYPVNTGTIEIVNI